MVLGGEEMCDFYFVILFCIFNFDFLKIIVGFKKVNDVCIKRDIGKVLWEFRIERY